MPNVGEDVLKLCATIINGRLKEVDCDVTRPGLISTVANKGILTQVEIKKCLDFMNTLIFRFSYALNIDMYRGFP